VDVQHHARRLFQIHLEKALEAMDDEFHRGVIVVEQQHLVLAGLFGLGPSARGKANAGPATIVTIPIGASSYEQY